MKELIDRLKTESPEWFKRLQIIIALAAGILGILQMLISAGKFPELIPWMPTITNIITGLAGAFGVSLLAKKTPDVKSMDDVIGDGTRPPLPPPPSKPKDK